MLLGMAIEKNIYMLLIDQVPKAAGDTAGPSTALRSVEKHSTGGELKTVGAPYLA